jgi:Na+:H+ antiporter, NhaA family
MTDQSKNALQRGLENIHYPLSDFIRAQTTTSLFLLVATIVALWWANSDYASTYQNLIHTPIGIFLGDFQLQASFKHIMNDGLMVIFFFLLGLEIKREMLAGDLADPESRRMLILCAIGGMLFPAAIYTFFNWQYDSQMGWGIPMATDTAFALGVLVLVRKYIPLSLLAFIVGLAIVDDIGAILVIAIFYTQEISLHHLFTAFILIAFLAVANYAGVRQPLFYLAFGLACWWMMLKSGVHSTFAGVAIALTVPARPVASSGKLLNKAKRIIKSMQTKKRPVDVLSSRRDHEKVLEVREFAERASTPLRRWEDALDLPVALFILPLFALTNAGIPFDMASIGESFQHPVGLGIMAGLVLGKFIGISGVCWFALRYNIGKLPQGVNYEHVIGASFIAGIGFTMSTFIATLGFDTQAENLHMAKTSIIIASIISAIIGVLFIWFTSMRNDNKSPVAITEN